MLYFESKESTFPSFFHFSLPHSHLSLFSFFLPSFLKEQSQKSALKEYYGLPGVKELTRECFWAWGYVWKSLVLLAFQLRKWGLLFRRKKSAWKIIYWVNIEVTGDIAVSTPQTQCHRGQTRLVSGHYVLGKGEMGELFSATSWGSFEKFGAEKQKVTQVSEVSHEELGWSVLSHMGR